MQWTHRATLAIVVALTLTAASMSATVLAQAPPARVFGNVTVNGEVPPQGTKVEAFIDGKLCGEGSVRVLSPEFGVGYVVDVKPESQEAGCGDTGRTIRFKVGGLDAEQTESFANGAFIRLNLIVAGALQPPPPGPTPPPFNSPQPLPTLPPSPTPTAAGSTPAPGASPAAASPAPSSSPSASGSPAPGASSTPAPAAAPGASPSGSPSATASPVASAAPPGDGGGGVPASVWGVLAIGVLAALVGGGVAYARRHRG